MIQKGTWISVLPIPGAACRSVLWPGRSLDRCPGTLWELWPFRVELLPFTKVAVHLGCHFCPLPKWFLMCFERLASGICLAHPSSSSTTFFPLFTREANCSLALAKRATFFGDQKNPWMHLIFVRDVRIIQMRKGSLTGSGVPTDGRWLGFSWSNCVVSLIINHH